MPSLGVIQTRFELAIDINHNFESNYSRKIIIDSSEEVVSRQYLVEYCFANAIRREIFHENLEIQINESYVLDVDLNICSTLL
jgi:hypothetical protein